MENPQVVASSPHPELKLVHLMQTLDDAWNAQDWDTFEARHAADTVVRWPAQPPTHGIAAHREESRRMFETFPDNHIDNRPYQVLFASGAWTCSIARWRGTMKGELVLADGRRFAPTGKSFDVDFCTVAHWRDGRIIEENLFYDVVGLMSQIGVQL